MKKIIGICLLMLIALTSIPFSAHAEMNDTEITLVPYDFSEQRYTPEYSEASQITLNSEREDLPSSFDSRDYGWVTPLKRQTWGTCWSHAILSTIETYNISQGFDDINADYSETHLTWFANTKSTDVNNPTYGDGITVNFSPEDYFVGELPDNADKMGAYAKGASHNTVIGALARWSGIANESDFPPEADGAIIDEAYRYDTGSGFIIKSAEWLNDITEVNKWVKNYGSATISFYPLEKFTLENNEAVSWAGDLDTSWANHEVAIIGWDDNFPMKEHLYNYWVKVLAEKFEDIYAQKSSKMIPPEDGAWLCKDSHERYIWISYYDPTISSIVGYTAQPANAYRQNYTYNGTGTHMYGEISGNASIANVFQTSEYEILSAISTYTVQENQALNVRIYTDIDANYTNPTQGTLVLDYITTISEIGYHTIVLPQNIKLNADTHFSVVVKYEATNGATKIPVECNNTYADINYLYSSNKGESFIGFSNGSVINYENNTIYGLTAGINSLERYTNIVADGCEWVYEPGKYGFGTGSKAVLKNGAETINEYTVIVFGDINGDGWYNGEDAFLVNLIANGMLDKNDVGEVVWSAADCNHDGVIDEADVDLLSSAGLLLNKIDQSSSSAELKSDTAYIEYISIINQSAGIDMITTDSDENTTDLSTDYPVLNPASTNSGITDMLSDIIKAIVKIITIVFRFV